MISNLVRQIYQADWDSKSFEFAEVGKNTWGEILDTAASSRREKMSDEEKEQIKEVYFLGVKVRMNPEVEEGKLWLVESAMVGTAQGDDELDV